MSNRQESPSDNKTEDAVNQGTSVKSSHEKGSDEASLDAVLTALRQDAALKNGLPGHLHSSILSPQHLALVHASSDTHGDPSTVCRLIDAFIPPSGLELVDGDTSYSDTTSQDNRGIAACDVTIRGVIVQHKNTNTAFNFTYSEISGVLKDGTMYSFCLPPLPTAQTPSKHLLDPSTSAHFYTTQEQCRRRLSRFIDADPFVGHCCEGWWVKARLPPNSSISSTPSSTSSSVPPSSSSSSSSSASSPCSQQPETCPSSSEVRYLVCRSAGGYRLDFEIWPLTRVRAARFDVPPQAQLLERLTLNDI